MASFGNYSLADLGALRAQLKDLVSTSSSLREAAGIFVSRLYEELEESLVLARLYGTAPFEYLGEREQDFARRLASRRQLLDEIGAETIVATLLASRGKKPEWNDPYKSRARLAVPLLNDGSLDTIPLLGRLLGDSKLGLPWLKQQQTLIKLETSGGMSQMLFVEDAGTSRSSDGGMVVRDQDFVAAHGVRTVLVLGGSYLNGSVIALVLFTSELITEEQSARFTPLVNTFKAATMKLVMAGRIA